jgi:thiol-disulfide isomerase/thioredoxin
MTQASKSIGAWIVTAGIVLLAGGSFPLFTAVAQSQTAPAPTTSPTRTAHRRGGGATVKAPAAPRAINAEELQGLLKRDGTHPQLVNYWATWCDPCRDEFPDLVKIDNEYRSKGLDFIAVTLDDLADLKTAVPKFLSLMKARMPVYLLNVSDPAPTIDAIDPKWGGALPATFLYNSKGEVVYKHFGRVDTVELRAAIEKIVGSKEQKAVSRRQ